MLDVSVKKHYCGSLLFDTRLLVMLTALVVLKSKVTGAMVPSPGAVVTVVAELNLFSFLQASPKTIIANSTNINVFLIDFFRRVCL